MDVNWLGIGLAAFTVHVTIFALFVGRRRWTWGGLGVGLVDMLVVGVHAVAPIRGLLDPGYEGYSFGLLRADGGPIVTLVAGSVQLAALIGACIAVTNPRGGPMLFLTAVNGVLLFVLGVPMATALVTEDLNDARIQFGEYLTIPGLAAMLLLFAALVVPLGASVWWSARRSSEAR